jgi:MFS family permease
MCIMAGCVVLSIGAAIQCTAYGIPHLIVGRIVAGIGNGLNTSTIRMISPRVQLMTITNFGLSCLAFGVEQSS